MTTKMVQLDFPDGCVFAMNPVDQFNEAGNGWQIDFPQGFSVTCPHGERIAMTDFNALPHQEVEE